MLTLLKLVTDMDIILECLHETYGMEGGLVLSGKNIHATMIFPFVKMLEDQCENISAEEIHKRLWELYLRNAEKDNFIRAASLFLEPYHTGDGDKKQSIETE